jgi:hypothetical protein
MLMRATHSVQQPLGRWMPPHKPHIPDPFKSVLIQTYIIQDA